MILHTLPLAQRETWERLGDRFSGHNAELQTADLLSVAAVACGALLFILLLRWLHGLQEGRRKSNHPRHLFGDLCSAHRLGYADRHRLQLLATAHELDSPGVLFLRPDYFREDQLPEELMEEAGDFERIASKIFARLEEPGTARDQSPAKPQAAYGSM
jgi:hypothetical protein